MWFLVGVPRFELGTSRTRTVRSTGLSHTPIYPFWGKRANYTIAIRFGKSLWVQEYFLTVNVEHSRDAVIILPDG